MTFSNFYISYYSLQAAIGPNYTKASQIAERIYGGACKTAISEQCSVSVISVLPREI